MSEQSEHNELTPTVRSEVIGFFRLLSDENRQRDLLPDAGSSAVAVELCRLWFDEIYIPSERYFESEKGELSEKAVQEFNAAFDADELEAMARFHRFLEVRLEMVSEQKAELADSPQWRSIIRDARETLDLLLA